MKKILSILPLLFFAGFCIFAAPINSKQGYKTLAWGSSVNDAKKAGYKLTPIDIPASLYLEPVNAYKAVSKDKNVASLQFHYYNGKLFFVSETLSSADSRLQALEDRYGNFNKQGIYLAGQQYTDATREINGAVSTLSIIISSSSGSVIAKLYNWNVYKNISSAGQNLSQNSNSILDRLSNLAEVAATDMDREIKGIDSPTLAVIPLTTDYHNMDVEDYITTFLSEALYATHKFDVYERPLIDRVLAELKFQESKFIDQSTAKQVGELVGVDFVCSGTIKDLGNSMMISIRILNVKTGKTNSIRSTQIKKDEYLKKQPQAAVIRANPFAQSPSFTKASGQTIKTTPAVPKKQAASNAWQCIKWRNEFDGYTQYIFRVFSTDERFVFLWYKKSDIKANSRVITGIHWGNDWDWNIKGKYDINSKEGTISKEFNSVWECTLDSSGKEKFKFVWNQTLGSRLLAERFKNNNTVALRREGLIRRFQTEGLLDKMAEYGISWSEIDAAIANEEF